MNPFTTSPRIKRLARSFFTPVEVISFEEQRGSCLYYSTATPDEFAEKVAKLAAENKPDFVCQIVSSEPSIRYELNQGLKLKMKDLQDMCQLLVEVLHRYTSKRTMGCGQPYKQDDKMPPEDSWRFSFKTPSDCGSCVAAQKILDKIFGSRSKFTNLPFVEYHGDRQYSWRFDLLKVYAFQGEEAVKQAMAELKEAETRAKAAEELKAKQAQREKNGAELDQMLGGSQISQLTRDSLLDLMDEKSIGSLKVIDPDAVVCKSGRSEWGNSGGIGYFSQAIMICHGERKTQEWCYRDRYDERKDRWDLDIHGIGRIETRQEADQLKFKIELLNGKDGKRWTEFSFAAITKPQTQLLSADEHAAFAVKVEQEIGRMMTDLEKSWERQPQMRPYYGDQPMSLPSGMPQEVPYNRPNVKQKSIPTGLGLAAFVLEVQIDHFISDAQVRYEVYVMGHQDLQAKQVFEDHSYERREGSALVTITNLNPAGIELNTRNGKRTIPFKDKPES